MDINGFGQLKDGRGNICPVTIIMPTLAMEAKERVVHAKAPEEAIIDSFMDLLDTKIHEAKDMLLERIDGFALSLQKQLNSCTRTRNGRLCTGRWAFVLL